MTGLTRLICLFLLSGMSHPILSAQNWMTAGEATARWGFIALYDASLRAPQNATRASLLAEGQALQLELCYARSLTVENFIESANSALPDELPDALAKAVDTLHLAYQPVNEGDCYLLDYQPNLGTALILNGNELVRINQPGFKSLYFGIWIGDKPLSNRLKNNLIANLP